MKYSMFFFHKKFLFIFCFFSFSSIFSANFVLVGIPDTAFPETDDKEIQRAIEFIDSLGGGTVMLSKNEFTIKNSIQLKSNIILRGDPSQKTILKKCNQEDAESPSFSVIIANNISNTKIKDLQINGNSKYNSTKDERGIKINNSNNISIINCNIYNFSNNEILSNNSIIVSKKTKKRNSIIHEF